MSRVDSALIRCTRIAHAPCDSSWDTLAAGTSSDQVHVFNVADGGALVRRTLSTENSQLSDICGVRFANTDSNLLYVGTNDGTIFSYDLRTARIAHKYRDNTTTTGGAGDGDSANRKKPLLCLDVNANDRLLAAGSERVGSDAFLLFFDTRQQKTLGSYWESHSDDITQVRFHPQRPDTLASGSTDGLINVYDLQQATEDDALEQCMNTESSVARLQWHTSGRPQVAGDATTDDRKDQTTKQSQTDRDLLSCITHVNDLHLYDVAEQDQVYAQDRDAMTAHMRRSAAGDCHVVGVHSTERPGSMLVLTGSNTRRGECLRSLWMAASEHGQHGESSRQLQILMQPAANFEGNKQVVRCSLYNAQRQVLVTAGEGGLITLWAPGKEEGRKGELKEKTKDRNRKHKAKPY